MFKKNRDKLKKFIFKKEDYPNYLEWLQKTDIETQKKIEKLSKFSISKSFDKQLKFSPDGLISEFEVGTSYFNDYTFRRLIEGISKYISSKSETEIAISTNNRKNYDNLLKTTAFFYENQITATVFENSVTTVGFLSYYLKQTNKSYGLYLNFIGSKVEILLINKTGDFFNEEEYIEVNRIIEDIQINFNPFPPRADYIKKISSGQLTIDYSDNFLSEINNFQQDNDKIIVAVHSDAVEELLRERNKNNNLIIVRSKEKKESTDISQPRAFIDAYKKAKKYKNNVLVAIDSSGQKLNLALKFNKTWRFLTSFELGMLFWNLQNQNNIKENLVLPSFFSKNSVSEGEANLSIGNNFQHKWKTTYLDSISLLNFVVGNFYKNGLIFQNKYREGQEKFGFFYEEYFRKTSTYEEFTTYISNLEKYKKMNDLEVKSQTKVFENEYFLTYKLTFQYSEVFLKFDKLTNTINEYFYTYDKDHVISFHAKRGLRSTINTFIDQREDNNIVHSAKGQKKLILFFILFVVATLSVFTFLFNWQEIWSATAIIFTSFNTVYPYLLFSLWFIGPLSGALVFYFVIKNYKPDTKLMDLYKAFILASFIYAISIIPAIGFAFFIWYLRTKNYKTSEIIPAISVEVVCSLFITILFNSMLIPYGTYYLSTIGYTSIFVILLAVIGFIWYMFAASFFLVISFSTKIQNFIFYWIEKALFFIRLENMYIIAYNEMEFNILNMNKNKKTIGQNKMSVVNVLLTMVAFRFILGLQAFGSINIHPDVEFYNLFAIMGIQSIVHYAGSFVPIPGGAGVVDVILLDILVSLTGDITTAKEVAFTWRFFGYYGRVMFVSIPFGIKLIKMNIQNKNKVRNIWV